MFADRDYLLVTFPQGLPRTMAARYEQIVDMATEHRILDEETGETIVVGPLITWAQARELLDAECTAAPKDKP